MHKEVNYDTNNIVGMAGRDVGGGVDEGVSGKTGKGSHTERTKVRGKTLVGETQI